jgi:hypothetical protein
MKFGVREICDVVLKAKAAQKIGDKIFYAGEPVIYFDTLKTSSLEGAATTVYAQGGRGNSRLVAWEGERTLTFTMEDALISPEGFMILSGAGLISASDGKPVYQHMTETIDTNDLVRFSLDRNNGVIVVYLENKPYLPANRGDNYAYAMFRKGDTIISEPYIPMHGDAVEEGVEIPEGMEATKDIDGKIFYRMIISDHKVYDSLAKTEGEAHDAGVMLNGEMSYDVLDIPADLEFDSILIDYYVERKAGATQMEITADKFGGNYYLEAATLFRNTDGVDMPAEFIIPNCKIQSNFTFTMASSGDPSTFTFTMDAFPDYTRFDHSKKVLAAIQVIEFLEDSDLHRHSTNHQPSHNSLSW